MADKDRIEALLKLAEASWRDYSARRSVEWKVNFALWAALGAFAGFLFQQKTALPAVPAIVTSVLFAIALLVYTFLWKVEVQNRNRRDLDAAQYYWAKVDKELDIPSPEVRNRQQKTTRWRATHLSQVIITVLFVLLALLAVWVPIWAGKS